MNHGDKHSEKRTLPRSTEHQTWCQLIFLKDRHHRLPWRQDSNPLHKQLPHSPSITEF
ncbi:hypothetical protein DAI22_02g010950 [Oryza sativa Japonica Group]|nr:hypothetical protein DAI22_02g010950 [Oryza sativa Japonica Group]